MFHEEYNEIPWDAGFEDDVSWNDVDLGPEEDDSYIGGVYKTTVDSGPRLINFQDYTLNSPLLSDGLQDFVRVYGSSGIEKKPKGIWGKRFDMLKDMKVEARKIKPIRSFHTFVGSLFSRTNINCNEIKKLISDTDDGASKTFDVVKAYVKTWIDETWTFRTRQDNIYECLKYGALMLDFLVITWILNASTLDEFENLKRKFKFDYINEPCQSKEKYTAPVVKIKLENLGTVFIGHGIVYLDKYGILADRNMILMIKDTCTARFHTLFAIRHRQFDRYDTSHEEAIYRMYQLGDKILINHSDIAYNVYGMIEPITSQGLADLARQHRPLIPEFLHFPKHIKKKTEEIQENSDFIAAFFDHLKKLADKRILLTAYGCFRHWGHPFIDYMEGLEALYKNVTRKTLIDLEYAKTIASDLTYKILEKEHRNKRTWFVDVDKVPDSHPFYHHIKKNTWPSSTEIMDFKGFWCDLPLKKCWDVPEVVDPPLIYSDKSHSINRSELLEHMATKPNKPIPTRRVMETFLKTPETNWPEFLSEIDMYGLDPEYLLIGLKAKERELKRIGRFFALMSWKLREYFVFTEYLIKTQVLPLFDSLTMADDQTTLTKKMLENTSGQGLNNYDHITIANHIDYNKWNNFQRGEATNPVFEVIGKFFGYPRLFCRTHEFFEQSLIYYRDRPDLMTIQGNTLVNKDDNQRVCWNGQLGGLEGLRQKGWSVVNLLVIERESKVRNTRVQILAQGDNQVICTKYSIHPHANKEELQFHINCALQNNTVIMTRIRDATESIGLFINEDETLQSADMLIYGKNIIFRGNVTCLEEKKYSRITCTSNDQLPGLGNIMSTISTNCLTVAHFSNSPRNAMVNYNWLGNFAAEILHIHNPALRDSPAHALSNDKKKKDIMSTAYRIILLFLDPSLGGISGMSLSRFHIRMFPDPVTEALNFWKAVHQGTENETIKRIAVNAGDPKLLEFEYKHFEKLVEGPDSLNLPRSLSVTNMLRDEIRKQLIRSIDTIQNRIVQDAIAYVKDQNEAFVDYLNEIEPCFPRFLCEFKAATYLGLTEGIVNLFENSNTLRTIFKERLSERVDKIIVKSELHGILHILSTATSTMEGTMWKCSSSQADLLRKISWKREIIGTTVPYPLEMIGKVHEGTSPCESCNYGVPNCAGVTVIIPHGLTDSGDSRGPYPPYFGSTTDENTSLLQSWEKTTDITFIRRASNMRRAFNWMVSSTGNLGQSLKGNLVSLTGEDPGEPIAGFKRTGSAIHRFGCSRVSAGGYMANNPVYGSRMIISSDLFAQLGDTNYDFMYQSLMLYCQQNAGERHFGKEESGVYHFHLSCSDCLRTIPDEIDLEAPRVYKFPDMSRVLSKWKPGHVDWFKTAVSLPINEGSWDKLPPTQQSYEVGKLQALIFTELYQTSRGSTVISNLFPLGMRDKVHGDSYLDGIKDGLMRGSMQSIIHRQLFYRIQSFDNIAMTCYLYFLKELVSFSDFLLFTQGTDIARALYSHNHRIPPSYPVDAKDLGLSAFYYLSDYSLGRWKSVNAKQVNTWIFADFVSVPLSGFLIVNHRLVAHVILKKTGKDLHNEVKVLKDIMTSVKQDLVGEDISSLCQDDNVKRCNYEVRFAVKNLIKPVIQEPEMVIFENKLEGRLTVSRVHFVSSPTIKPSYSVPRILNPLISAIRTVQLATGSWYKLQVIFNAIQLQPSGALCVGDGSGGISALILRTYPTIRLIFNSLMDMNNVVLGGSLPKPPAALDQMGSNIKGRCVNLSMTAQMPSDLRRKETWDYFLEVKTREAMTIDLIVMDMEITSEEDIEAIDKLLVEYVGKILSPYGTLIVKTYLNRIINSTSIVETLGKSFANVLLTQTEWSSSQTSEIYVVMTTLLKRNIQTAYVNWELTADFLSKVHCQRTYREEFNRARQMLKQNTEVGIPRNFLPDPKIDILNIWIDCGGNSTTLTRWGSMMLGEFFLNSPSHAFYSLTLVSLDVLDVTHLLTTKRTIPSDNCLEKFFSLYVGTWLYIALLTKNHELAEQINQLICKPFNIYFAWIPLNIRGMKVPGENLIWSFLKSSKHFKTVYLQRKMALIGHVLRTYIRIEKELKGEKSRLASKGFVKIHPRPAVNVILERTGLLDFSD